MSLAILAVSGIRDSFILSVLQMPGMGIVTSRMLSTAAVGIPAQGMVAVLIASSPRPRLEVSLFAIGMQTLRQ